MTVCVRFRPDATHGPETGKHSRSTRSRLVVDVRFLETTDPSLVIAQSRSEGTALSTGNPYDQDYISVVETRDGLITRYVDYWNPLIFLKALNTSADEAYGAFTS